MLNRQVGAQAVGHQHGGRKSVKISGIHFCYKTRLFHPHEQENIHINTSCKTSSHQDFLNIRDSLLAAILISCDVVLRNSKPSILKTAKMLSGQRSSTRHTLRTPNSQ